MRQFNPRHQPFPLLSIRERFLYENEGGRDFTSHRDRIEKNNVVAIL